MLKAARLFDGKSDALLPNGMVIVEGKTDQGRRLGARGSRGLEGDRPGRCNSLPGLHRRPHASDARADSRLQPGVRRRDAPGGRGAGDPVDGLRPAHDRSGVHDGARRRLGRFPRRRAAELDRQGGCPRPADAGLRARARGRSAAIPTKVGCGTTCFRSATRPRGSPAARTGFARRCATRSSMVPT